ncbi:unnamed protein product [Brassicogethes aeneus]|uniref:Uncharacterized protein n=1 Tax=Brassicogethes aeneus TaxID=1431903 RepID=A0A9P0FJF1_BRAAE|nr:unnamed protein product [Brassicogethes aeneus]
MPRKYIRKCPERIPVTEEQIATAKVLIAKGMSKRGAANKIGICESTLRKRLKLNTISCTMGRSKPTFEQEEFLEVEEGTSNSVVTNRSAESYGLSREVTSDDLRDIDDRFVNGSPVEDDANSEAEDSISENKEEYPSVIAEITKHKKRKIENPQTIPITSRKYYHTTKDGCSTYGEHVGNEIRTLPSKSQIIVKHLINNILFDAAMGVYEKSN